MERGIFVTFEGGEGSGKSTQIRLLEAFLKEKGKEVLLTREPGGSQGAEEIRGLLLKGGKERWDKKTEMLLFSAARRDHLVKKIWPALADNQIVLCDRFADSTLAYQCFGYGFNEETYKAAQNLYQMIAGNFKPDMTFVLDIDPQVGLARSKNRCGNDEQRFEDMEITFHTNIRNAFLKLSQEEPNRFILIDASQSIERIHKDILDAFQKRLSC